MSSPLSVMSAARLLGALLVFSLSLLVAPSLARAQDSDAAATARRHWQTCKALLEGGDPCAALTACDAGLAAAPTKSLEALRETALARCSSHASVSRLKDRDNDGVPDRDDDCDDQAEDIDGFQDTDGCPDPDNDGDTVADATDMCPFAAEDLDSFEDDDGCPDLDNDNDGLADADDMCPLHTEDLDGFQDDDGCPDEDNDNDGLADLQDSCPLAAEDLDGFEDTDGCPEADNDNDGLLDEVDACPLVAEDLDDFEDTDGCPDLDNDGDGYADLEDTCPLAVEDFDGWADDDGCPETDDPWSGARWGWIVTGSLALAAGGTALGLHLAAESELDDVRQADDDGVNRNVRQVDVPDIEARAEALDTAAVISGGVGGALLLTAVTLLALDFGGAFETEGVRPDAGPTSWLVPTLGTRPEGGLEMGFAARF